MQVMNAERARRASSARAGKNRRKGLGHPAVSEVLYDSPEVEFMFAIEEYKRQSGHKFPAWSEVLRVLKSLGYEKQPILRLHRPD